MKRIMALIDFSPVTSAVINVARDMVRAFQGELTLVHVNVAPSELDEDEARQDTNSQAACGDGHARDMEILKLMLTKVGIKVKSEIVSEPHRGGSPISRILEEISRYGPELIVIGSHPHGRLHHLLADGATEAVIRKAACPIVVVPDRMAEKRTL